eukprot:s1286_g5.t1
MFGTLLTLDHQPETQPALQKRCIMDPQAAHRIAKLDEVLRQVPYQYQHKNRLRSDVAQLLQSCKTLQPQTGTFSGGARSDRAGPAATVSLPEVLRFVWPVMLTFLASTVQGLIDSAFVGRCGGSVQLAALAPGTSSLDSLSYLLSFISIGTLNVLATAKDAESRERLLSRSVMVAWWVGAVAAGFSFHLHGLIDGGHDTYSLVNVKLSKQFPSPVLVADEHSRVLFHDVPSWDDFHSTIDLCCGFGGMTQGLLPLGFETKVAVDWNKHMTGLFASHSDAAVITGDVGSLDTIVAVWEAAKGACTGTAGFACQPFSRLGDELGRYDSRSACLTDVLNLAILLRIQVLVLECVRFACSEIDLRLSDVWPCRRQRAWWVLHSDLIGPVRLESWPPLSSLQSVDQLIPQVHRWDPRDEMALSLNVEEQTAFGVLDGTYPKYLLNGKGLAPTALHAWGSQLHPCPCQCRSSRLSAERLSSKGLFGLLVRSASDSDGVSQVRHVHPNEVMGMNGFDPVLDFGPHVKLTLSAAGQMASPLQVAWILGHVKQQIDAAMGQVSSFSPLAQLHAFRAWLVMRCQEVWPVQCGFITDESLNALVGFWKPYSALSMQELMYPPRWNFDAGVTVTIAEILDHVIRLPSVPPAVPCVPKDEEETPSLPASWTESNGWFESAPVSVSPGQCMVLFCHTGDSPVQFAVQPGASLLEFAQAQNSLDGTSRVFAFATSEGVALPSDHVLTVGQCVFASVMSESSSGDLEMEPAPADAVEVKGDLGCLTRGLPCAMPVTNNEPAADPAPFVPGNDGIWECGPLPKLPSVPDLQVTHDVGLDGFQTDPVPLVPGNDGAREWGPLPKLPSVHAACDATEIDPTATWTQLPQTPVEPVNACCPAVFDVGECQLNSGVSAADSWISAAPLLGLSDTQFLALQIPSVLTTSQLWSLRHQFIHVSDRQAILDKQALIVSDDEIRFHLHQFCKKVAESAAPCCPVPVVLDPLLSSSWHKDRGHMCRQWCSAHPEVLARGVPVISVFMLNHHWVPAVMFPVGKTLHVCTWDAVSSDHAALNSIWESMSKALGFDDIMIKKEHRMFLTSSLCGTLALAYVQQCVLKTMLPTNPEEVSQVHERFRQQFAQALLPCEVAARPWVWGSGDSEESERVWPSDDDQQASSIHASGQLTSQDAGGSIAPDEPWPLHYYEVDTNPRWADRSRSHRCISAEDRIQLIAFHGKDMADDEVRFLLRSLLSSSENVARQPGSAIPGFACIEPLTFRSWDDVGRALMVKWCQDNFVVRTRGFHIVSVIPCDAHWTPLWIQPVEDMLLVHVLDDSGLDDEWLRQIVDVLVEGLQFDSFVIHRTPLGLPAHRMCGPHALAFLAHLIVGAVLPVDLQELDTLRVAMRSSFVAAVYTDRCCRCPTFWGAGQGNLTKQLAAELLQHGVPESQVESRAAQAIKSLGSDQVLQALAHKQPWRQLKSLANNARFQFLLPSELDALIQQNKGHPVGKKPKKAANVKPASLPEPAELDPAKLQILDGSFGAMVRAGTAVSQEPLALVVLAPPGADIVTALPHCPVTVPCRCVLDQEPVLVEACLVQLGNGVVEKAVQQSAVELDALDVLTIKVLIYRDEFQGEWEAFVGAPIKHIVSTFPVLRRCFDLSCSCDAWHNRSNLPIREPILDVWRRQYLKQGFKPVAPLKADYFTVSLRVPKELVEDLLSASGRNGFYTEPRSADGKTVLEEYVVVWAPRHSMTDLQHLRQTNPAIVGLARTGERKGVRVHSAQAQTIHQLIRPDALWLPQGQKTEYVAGPFPYGLDRHAIGRAFQKLQWQTKPLQPTAPVPGRGTMWLLHAVDPPPESILWTSHGEVVITKHKQPEVARSAPAATVGSATTLSLCGTAASDKSGECDPWSKHDPWSVFQPVTGKSHASTPSASMIQMEQRIQQAVMAKIPQAAPMEDDLPDRLCALEHQVQGMLGRQQQMETQFSDFSQSHSKQLAQMHTQISNQTQHLQGQRLTPSWDAAIERSSRVVLSTTLLQDVWVSGGVVYGEPDGHLYPRHKEHNEALIQAVALHVGQLTIGPRFIAGDFNEQEGSLEAFALLKSLGFADLQELAMRWWGHSPRPTCKGRTRKDFCFISPELQQLLLSVRVRDDVWPDHSILEGKFRSLRLAPPKMIWPCPQPFVWPLDFDVDPEWWSSCPGDPTKQYARLWAYLEDQAASALPFGVGPRMKGRANTFDLRPVKGGVGAPVKPARLGEFQPNFHGVSTKHAHFVRQSRRLQSFLRFVQNGHFPDDEHGCKLWGSILRAKGFEPNFAAWWATCEHRVVGAPGVIPYVPPNADTALAIADSVVLATRALEQSLIASSKQYAKFRRSRDPNVIFKDIRAPPAQGLELLCSTLTAKVVSVNPDDCSICLDGVCDWRPDLPLVSAGRPLSVIHAEADCLWLDSVESLEEGSVISQVRHKGTVEDIAQDLLHEWGSRWNRHADVPADRWQVILDFSKRVLPRGCLRWSPLDVTSLRACILRKKRTTSCGLDGVTIADLRSMPAHALQNFLAIFQDAEVSGRWPAQLVDGKVSCLAKNPDPQGVLEFRPITVLGLLYRCWSSHQAREAIRALESVLPATLFGSRPGCHATQVWGKLLWSVEHSFMHDIQLSGLNADIVKAFNHLPRLVVFEACAWLGLPPPMLLAWAGAVSSMQRRFQIRGSLSDPIGSCTGFAEGDALSCVAMVVVDLLFHAWHVHFFPLCTPVSFVDDWQLLCCRAADVLGLMQCLTQFVHHLDLLLDQKKTFAWSVCPEARAMLRAAGLRVELSCRNLGAHVQFSRKHTNSVQLDRFSQVAAVWPRLRSSAGSYEQKLRAIKVSAWPRALHAISATTVSLAAFQQLRAGAVKALDADGAGVNAHVHLGLVHEPSLDPQFYAIVHTMRMVQSCGDPSVVRSQLVSLVTGLEAPANSITATLLSRVQALGWSVDHRGRMVDCFGTFSLFRLSYKELVFRASYAWQLLVAAEVAHRPGFASLHRIEPRLTRRWLRSLSRVDRGLFRKLLNGLCEALPGDIFALVPSLPECVTCYGWNLRAHTFHQWFSTLAAIEVPSSRTLEVTFADLHLFTDGSCFHQHCELTRFAAWAVVRASRGFSECCDIVGAGPLPGLLQSAYRAEVFALLQAVLVVPVRGGRVFLWSDCEAVVDTFNRLLQGWVPKSGIAHADLWDDIFFEIHAKGIQRFAITHVSAHRSVWCADGFHSWCFSHNALADRTAVRANLSRPAEFWRLWHQHVEAVARAERISSVLQTHLLKVSQAVLQAEACSEELVPLKADVAADPDASTWPGLATIDVLPAGAVRWYGTFLVRQMLGWFFGVLQAEVGPLVWVSHCQLYLDFQLTTGSVGPLKQGKWIDGSALGSLAISQFPFNVRTRAFAKVLKESLRHSAQTFTYKYGLPKSKVLSFHTGTLALPWSTWRLDCIDQLLLKFVPEGIRRSGNGLNVVPVVGRDVRFPSVGLFGG